MELKRKAALAAVDRVRDGMILGLGTGSTVRYAIERVGQRVAEGWNLVGVPTSRATAELAEALEIPLTTLDEHPNLDLTIDGADEVDPRMNLTKGLGGALLREKIVAAASKAFLVVVDESKVVEALGEKAPLPVEVLPFGVRRTQASLEALGCEPTLRRDGEAPFRTDNGNYVIHCRFDPIEDPMGLARRVKEIPGVIEHGLFLEMAETVFVGTTAGVTEMRRPSPAG
ncbi:MAG: ribose-5-phosphate isomerase RpiA [Candidatus Thermoplasmatota archaeon]|nr:ribose-5-phosphate isomerase RpiA [Candidatus Thermoplasmatota archaeon]